ncbi:MAG: hypothetical protein JW932_04075 [Deltaproteobacteria bacterium]|nr:hypothetical protein [Deltaproteobacteria bacterium]
MGDIFKGTVTQKFSQGEILINAQGRQFRAYTGLNLPERSEHHFQVRSLGSKVELKVLDGVISKEPSTLQLWASGRANREQLSNFLLTLSGARHLKGLSSLSIEALKNSSQLVPSIIFNDQIKNGKEWMARFLAGSGLFWENKIVRHFFGEKATSWRILLANDLKGTLLSLIKVLRSEKQGGEGLEKVIADIEQAVYLIEEDQILNLSSMREGLGWFWLIPGRTDEGFHGAELFVKDTKDDGEIRFSMFLSLSHLGSLEVDVSVIQSVLGIKVLVEDEQKVTYVKENLPYLEKALHGLGLGTGTIICEIKDVTDEETGPFSHSEGPFVHIVI